MSESKAKYWGANFTNDQIRTLKSRFLRGQNPTYLLDLITATIEIRAPIFLFESLGRLTQITDLSAPSDEFFEPCLTDIRSPSNELDLEMQSHLKITLASLNASTLALSVDGCDSFTASILTPTSNLKTKLLIGSLREFATFVSFKQSPLIIKPYQKMVYDILISEFPDFVEVFTGGKKV